MNGNGRVNGRLPRYHQIAQALRARIREGTLRPGARLETQRRLATSFGVTLMTLRQALDLLEREHLISRRHGLGTFVAAPSIDYRSEEHTSELQSPLHFPLRLLLEKKTNSTIP